MNWDQAVNVFERVGDKKMWVQTSASVLVGVGVGECACAWVCVSVRECVRVGVQVCEEGEAHVCASQ